MESAFQFDFALVATKRLSDDLSSEDLYLDCSYATDDRFNALSWQVKKTFARILKGKPVVLASIERIEEWSLISDDLKHEIQSSVYLPVIGQRNAAIIMFFNRTSGFYTNHHKSLASKLNNLLNQAILTVEKTEMIKETLSLVNSKNKEIVGIKGKITMETKNMFIIKTENGKKSIPKNICQLSNNEGIIETDSSKLSKSPHERLEMSS